MFEVHPSFTITVTNVARNLARIWVTSWELAWRLSFFLWSSLPDDGLFESRTVSRLRRWLNRA